MRQALRIFRFFLFFMADSLTFLKYDFTMNEEFYKHT